MVAMTPEAAVVGAEEEPRRSSRVKSLLDNYLLRRLFRAVLTIFFVSTLIFFLVRLLPGNPIEVYINQQITQYGYSYEEAANQARSLFAIDTDQPMILQYFDYLKNLAQGDLGMSVVVSGTSVASIIQSRIWWTVFSVGSALLISFFLGSLIGMLMAYRRGGKLDNIMTTFASLTNSIPNYLLALMVIVFFGVQLGWIPYTDMRGSISSGQQVEFSLAFFGDAIYHAILPVSVYVLTSIGGWMLLMKSSTISALEEDYVTAARARGIPEWRVLLFYVGRNAILPLFTQLTISIGFVVGGSLLVEPIFQYQGIGQRLFEAIQQRDYSTLQGIFLMITISVVVANLIADLLYSRLDPRIRSKG
ncbi:MAG TPA: ABC transporter permease [Thermomicrobiales bacterium]|jgi:peptide/nickel transport system permease protein|nr:ABC transporter permease [Thermomicrobiales bacterium]